MPSGAQVEYSRNTICMLHIESYGISDRWAFLQAAAQYSSKYWQDTPPVVQLVVVVIVITINKKSGFRSLQK